CQPGLVVNLPEDRGRRTMMQTGFVGLIALTFTLAFDPMTSRRRAGVTILESIIVLVITLVLVALLLTAVYKIRDTAARIECASKLQTMGLALHSYHDANGAFPSQQDVWHQSWMYKLLPYMDQTALYRQAMSSDAGLSQATWSTI